MPLNNVKHELRTKDLKALVELDCRESGDIELVRWIDEIELNTKKDTVRFADLKGVKITKEIVPDVFFSVRYLENMPTAKGGVRRQLFAIMIVVDMGKHVLSYFTDL